MSQLVRLDGVMREFGFDETRLSLLMKDNGIKCVQHDDARYVDYEDLMSLIRIKSVKYKVDAEDIVPQAAKDRLLSIKEACETLSCSRATIYRLRAQGVINTVTVGKSPRISRNELLRTVE